MTEEKAHAKLSASGSGMWLNCPGSIKANEKVKDTGSKFAEEGTMAHEIADQCLKGDHVADHYIDKPLSSLGIKLSTYSPDHVITKEMCDYVQEYLDYVYAHQSEDYDLYTERRVDFSNVVPEGFGTLDSAVLDYTTRTLHIFDLKYGKGVLVNAFENTQGQMYAIGMVNEIGYLDAFDDIRIHIAQPRISGGFSHWDISVADLELFAAWVGERAQLALTDSAPRVAGEKQCKWCGVKDSCKALAKFTEDTLMLAFDDLDGFDDDSENLTMDEKIKILSAQKLIEDFLKANKESLFTIALNGEEVPGYKLVAGRSNAVWVDTAESEIVNELGDEAYNKKLIGVTEGCKKLGKDKVLELTYKPPGKPTMVVESDKRPSINLELDGNAFDSFEN